MTHAILRAMLVLTVVCSAMTARAQAIHFAGYDWTVKTGDGLGPGPNNWSASNARVDCDGLHLKLSNVAGKWYSVEVQTTQRLGFGTYQFDVIGRIDQLDQNVVLGLFNYPTPDVGADGTNEIDIEFAHWGSPAYPIGNYTVWPAASGVVRSTSPFDFTLDGTWSSHRFTWSSSSVLFESLYDHQDPCCPNPDDEFASWLFQPATPLSAIPQNPLPLHMNLWLFRGAAPTDGKEVEIIISDFTFIPE